MKTWKQWAAVGVAGLMLFSSVSVFRENISGLQIAAFAESETEKTCTVPTATGTTQLSYRETDAGTVEITKCDENVTGELQLPDTIDQKSVTRIGKSAFYACPQLTGIEIPDGVTAIGAYAFSDCNALSQASIPRSVVSIGNDAFSWECPWLQNLRESQEMIVLGSVLYATGEQTANALISSEYVDIAIPDGVKTISKSLFETTSLRSVVFPSSLETIETAAFSLTKLESLTLPDGVKTIQRKAFCQNSDLKTVSIPASVEFIGQDAFSQNKNLEAFSVAEDNSAYCSVDGVLYSKDMTTLIAYPPAKAGTSYRIPDTVKTISCCAFYDSRLETIEIPDSVTSIGALAFCQAKSLKKLEIPDSVQDLGGGLFECWSDSALTEVRFPEGITHFRREDIGSHAQQAKGMVTMLGGCSSLQTLFLPSTITTLESVNFSTLSALKDIFYNGSEEQWEKIEFYDNTYIDKTLSELLKNVKIHFQDGTSKIGLSDADLEKTQYVLRDAEGRYLSVAGGVGEDEAKVGFYEADGVAPYNTWYIVDDDDGFYLVSALGTNAYGNPLYLSEKFFSDELQLSTNPSSFQLDDNGCFKTVHNAWNEDEEMVLEDGSVYAQQLTIEAVNKCFMGDYNHDCVVNGMDLVLLRQAVQNGTADFVQQAVCDINGDGVLNDADVQQLQQYLEGESVAFSEIVMPSCTIIPPKETA